jgi:hypothetical protein
MTAGSGSDAIKASRLEAALIAVYGHDFRDKVIVGAVGSFRLADAFEECGLVDPQRPPPSSAAYGLWQMYHERDAARRLSEHQAEWTQAWRTVTNLVLNETCAKRGGKCDCAGPCKLDAP